MGAGGCQLVISLELLSESRLPFQHGTLAALKAKPEGQTGQDPPVSRTPVSRTPVSRTLVSRTPVSRTPVSRIPMSTTPVSRLVQLSS